MSKKIDDFFNAYPGLDLIQNPKKCRRTKWFGRENDNGNGNGNGKGKGDDNQNENKFTGIDTVELYKKEMIKHLESFTIPLAKHKKSDCLNNLLEAGYHYFLNKSAIRFSDLEKKIDSGGSSVQDNVLSGGKVENVDLDDQNNIISEVLNDIIESISS